MAKFPQRVYLIRHGEKPGIPDDDSGQAGPDLSLRGSARAAALPSLFTPDPTGNGPCLQQLSCQVSSGKPANFNGLYQSPEGAEAPGPRFAAPKHIVATKTSKHSNRPIETVTPTSQALGRPIHAEDGDDDYDKAAKKILDKHAGEIVLVCWHHGKLPELTASLGVPQAQIDQALGGPNKKWPGTLFDWIWTIDWDGGQANLTPGFQQLLFGDQAGK